MAQKVLISAITSAEPTGGVVAVQVRATYIDTAWVATTGTGGAAPTTQLINVELNPANINGWEADIRNAVIAAGSPLGYSLVAGDVKALQLN